MKNTSTSTLDNNTLLTEQKCMTCEGGVVPFSKVETDILCKQIPGWDVLLDAKKIFKR